MNYGLYLTWILYLLVTWVWLICLLILIKVSNSIFLLIILSVIISLKELTLLPEPVVDSHKMISRVYPHKI
jgi:hypothetical protein